MSADPLAYEPLDFKRKRPRPTATGNQEAHAEDLDKAAEAVQDGGKLTLSLSLYHTLTLSYSRTLRTLHAEQEEK